MTGFEDSPSPSPGTETTIPLLAPENGSKNSNPPSRWLLTLQARIWRFLAGIGFILHTIPFPRPPSPSFTKSYTTAALNGSLKPASLDLVFYVPSDYQAKTRDGKKYPVVVNFYGGGFTLGRPTDDARWAAKVVEQVDAVLVSVQYRLAPEHPFPTGVEDGVCALLDLAANAESLGIDPKRICLSGFSAGGNLAFTVPLRLHAYLQDLQAQGHSPPPNIPGIIAIIAWYPSLDNRLSRAERRASALYPAKTLPPILTSLFDASYFLNKVDAASPYASPNAASDEILQAALPDDIAMYLCEWDMLVKEGREFEEKLGGLGKRVRCELIKERKHAFDKSPWPFGVDGVVGVWYTKACQWVGGVLGENAGGVGWGHGGSFLLRRAPGHQSTLAMAMF